MTDHFLDEVGHFLEIGVGPVGFEHRELRIVFSRNSLVPEISIQLEDFIKPAHE
jgi:hypothetical protein